ncbi:MAG: HAD-IA family hydrolase [Gemmatimonadetes bacterium]|nr:HAD-IA family hydrolase [Gemmatimonadota bacterium]
MPKLRAVLLDAGGTLIHPDHEFILGRLAEEGVEADATAYEEARRRADAVVGDILRSDDPGDDDTRIHAWFVTLLTVLGLPGERLAAVGEDIRMRHEEDALWIRPVPGTLEMLRGLRAAGLRLGVISNADGRVARYLANAGLADEFEIILDSGELGIEKPDPRIFQLALERLGVRSEEAVYVGDTWEVDVVGAREAGLRPIYLGAPRDGVRCIAGILELPAALDIEPSR